MSLVSISQDVLCQQAGVICRPGGTYWTGGDLFWAACGPHFYGRGVFCGRRRNHRILKVQSSKLPF
jgi:hypothetical protein